MSQYIPQLSAESLSDKIILITGIPCPIIFPRNHNNLTSPGGANGIGASLVFQCLESGANVCFGDLDNIEGERLLRKALAQFPTEPGQPPRAVFQSTDVTNYQSLLGLFDLAFKTYNHIDHVVSAAGIVEIGNWFDFGLTLQTVREVSLRTRPPLPYLGPLEINKYRRLPPTKCWTST